MPYNSIRMSMIRWRRSNTPNIPENLEQLAQILQTGEWPRYGRCQNGSFFSGFVMDETHRAIIFGNVEFVANFTESQTTFLDGTFKAVPRRPTFGQILTIFSTCMDHVRFLLHFTYFSIRE